MQVHEVEGSCRVVRENMSTSSMTTAMFCGSSSVSSSSSSLGTKYARYTAEYGAEEVTEVLGCGGGNSNSRCRGVEGREVEEGMDGEDRQK